LKRQSKELVAVGKLDLVGRRSTTPRSGIQQSERKELRPLNLESSKARGHGIASESRLRRMGQEVTLADRPIATSGPNWSDVAHFLRDDGENRSPFLWIMSTPEQEKLLIVLRHGMPDVDGRNDPPNMNALMQRLERLGLKDEKARPLCREVLAVALRANRFDAQRAIEALLTAIYPDPGPPLASIPSQERLVVQVMRSHKQGTEAPRPGNLDGLIAPLKALELKDEDGNLLCREVLRAALDGSLYEINDAAECLLDVTGQRPSGDLGPCTDEQKLIERLRRLFVHLEWSTIATACKEAHYDMGKTLTALTPLAAEATPPWD
jgi:hypothetical protein